MNIGNSKLVVIDPIYVGDISYFFCTDEKLDLHTAKTFKIHVHQMTEWSLFYKSVACAY